MSPPKQTIWEIKPHTKAKHLILEEYLKAWFPILSRWNSRVVYYDGFAGPGVYSGGEKGSPVIALDVAKSHRDKLKENLVFIFVEKNKDRAENLKNVIGKETLPNNYKVQIKNEEFETDLGQILDYLDEEKLHLAPTFAFIDPFGITGLPFSLIRRFLENQKCEVLITFMNSTMRRFPEQLRDQINELIGNPNASDIIRSSGDRIAKARELYQESLKRIAKFVCSFGMRNRNNDVIYYLFFATNHPLGHQKMKEAMWKADQTAGMFDFSDATNPEQPLLFSPTPQNDLAPILGKRFQGRSVDSKEVFRYTNDETIFLEKHARSALKLLESSNGYNDYKIQVELEKKDGTARKKGTFPSGITIKFC